MNLLIKIELTNLKNYNYTSSFKMMFDHLSIGLKPISNDLIFCSFDEFSSVDMFLCDSV